MAKRIKQSLTNYYTALILLFFIGFSSFTFQIAKPRFIQSDYALGLTRNTSFTAANIFLMDSVPQQDNDSSNKVFSKVEIEAEYPGGQSAWIKYMVKHLRYPDDAVNKHIEGDMDLQFIVDINGNVSDIKIISGPEELRAAVIHLIRGSGKWVPAVQNGKKVASYKRKMIKMRLE